MKRILTQIVFLFLTAFSAFAQDNSKGEFSGLMFGDYFYNISRDTAISSINHKALDGKEDLNGFQFRRIYFTYDYDISKTFSSRFRLEFKQTSSGGSTEGELIIKDAYLKWKNIFQGSDLIFGIQPTPAFRISEEFWGYRSIEKTILDLRGVVSSRDLAISLKGKLDKEGDINYWVMLGNNSSNISETDKYKRIYAHLNFNLSERIIIAVYGDLKLRENVIDPVSFQEINHDVFTTALFLGFEEDNFSIGAKGFLQLNQNDELILENSGLIRNDRNALGISVFGNYVFFPKMSFLARYDTFDPNTDFMNDARNYFIFGLNYKPHPKVEITPNILIETYEEMQSRKFDPSITARITIYYSFL